MKKIIFIFIVCLLLVGCTSSETKEAGTLEQFLNSCLNHGLEYADKLDDYKAQNVDYITGALRCMTDTLTIEMVIYDSEESADKAQKQHIASFKGMKSTAASAHNNQGKNYKFFSMISNNYYMVSNRIDNTLIFTKTPFDNKDLVDTLLTEMNY